MNISLLFVRVVFVILSMLFMTAYAVAALDGGANIVNIILGVVGGTVFGFGLIGIGSLLKRFNVRAFNTAILGIFLGYLLGQAILLVYSGIVEVSHAPVSSEVSILVRTCVFLCTIYIGMVLVAKASEEIYVSVPFVKFKPTNLTKKDILIDASILTDPRIIDLASSGLLDQHLLVPRFIMADLYQQAESSDEMVKSRARRSLEVIKKLESLPTLNLRYIDNDFPEIKDLTAKLTRLARFLDANIITSDISRIQQASIEGVKVINIHALSNALKPVTPHGEFITIKIQRYGKEAKQGVGYLDDGTMVVVNGGADFLAQSIKAQVLSVKHTASGRMIFCNAMEGDPAHLRNADHEYNSDNEFDDSSKSFFAV